MAPPSRPDWRDPAPYRRLSGIDRAGMRWEWLRRDPAYVAWYTSASKATRDQPGAADRLTWGLHFRRGPGPGVTRRAPGLACARRARYPARRCAACRCRACRPVRSCPIRVMARYRRRSRGARARRALGRLSAHSDRHRAREYLPRSARASPIRDARLRWPAHRDAAPAASPAGGASADRSLPARAFPGGAPR